MFQPHPKEEKRPWTGAIRDGGRSDRAMVAVSVRERYPGPMLSSTPMAAMVYHVHADWDPEADVWVATSDDVPGLATEASTIEALAEKLRIMIPELLEANHLVSGTQSEAISFELTSHRQERVRLAS